MNDQSPNSNHQAMVNNQSPNDQTRKRPFDLEKRTTNFAKAVIRLCRHLPVNSINIKLIGQVVASSGSVGANYREANDSLSKKDFLFRLKITRKEAKESEHWLELLLEANCASKYGDEINMLRREANELKSIFSAIITKLNCPSGG